MIPALLWTLAGILVIVGLAGTVMPGLPGAALVCTGLVVAAWVDGFTRVGGGTVAVLGILALLSLGADLLTAGVGAKRAGASRWAVVGAALGGVFGLFFGLPGVLLGPFAGAVAGELLSGRDWLRAGKAGFAAWVGFLLGSVARLALAFAMVGVFAVAYLF